MSNILCNGDGSCLQQTDYRNGYKKNDDISCEYNCQPIKCPNYLVCEHLEPQHILWCHKGICMSPCAISFKRLQFFENTECPICFETTICVKQVNCEHKTCIDCFKRCHLPPYWDDPQPEFPYSSDIEDDHDNDYNNPKWDRDPLIKKYREDLDKWQIEREIREESESYLKVCPLCRK